MSSCLVIERENLDPVDVILLTSGYKVPISQYTVIESPGFIHQNFIERLVHINFPKYFDSQISEITKGDQFIAYIDLMSYHQRLLVTHQNCLQFHFTEEGSLSYLDNDDLSSVVHLDLNGEWRLKSWKNYRSSLMWYLSKAVRGYSKRLLFMPFNYRAYAHFANIKYYCFSSLAYPGLDSNRKVVLNIRQAKDIVQIKSHYVNLSDAIVWVDDSLVRAYPRYKKTYTEALKTSIGVLKERFPGKTHFLKLRPKWKKEQSLTYNVLNQHLDDVKIIPEDTVMEVLLLKSKPCIIVGNVSIVLFYAGLIGHKVYSLFPLLENTDDLLFKNNMSALWENTQPVTMTNHQK